MEQRLLSKHGLLLALGTLFSIFLGQASGLEVKQIFSLASFVFTILGTILFWEFRLSFAFFSTSFLLFSRVANLEDFLRFSSMEIILFLIGMMVVVGFLKEIGVFNWFLQRAMVMKNLTAKK